MNDHVTSEGEIVSKRPLDVVPAFEVLADAAENQRRQQAAKPVTQQSILAQGRAVKHLPQPNEGFPFRILLRINFRIVFRLGGYVARVQ